MTQEERPKRPVPDFIELHRRAREAPGGVFGYALARTRDHADDAPLSNGPAAADLRRLWEMCTEALRDKGLLAWAALWSIGLRVKHQAARWRTRSHDSLAMLASASATVGNAIMATAFAGTVVVAIIAGAAPPPNPSFRLTPANAIVNPEHRGAEHRTIRTATSDSDGALDHRIDAQLRVPNSQHSVGAKSSIERKERRLVIGAQLRSWLPLIPWPIQNERLFWVECDSSLRRAICDTYDEAVALVPLNDAP